MYFDNLQAALDMGGHGPYVWSAYVLTFVVIALLLLAPFQRMCKARQIIRTERRRCAITKDRVAQAQDPSSQGG